MNAGGTNQALQPAPLRRPRSSSDMAGAPSVRRLHQQKGELTVGALPRAIPGSDCEPTRPRRTRST
jgi:hypothetical protein